MLPDDSFSHPISTLDSDELDNLDSNNTIGNIFSVGDELVEVTIETNADTTTAQGGGDVSFEVEILPWLHEA
jgi:hypothetical protein